MDNRLGERMELQLTIRLTSTRPQVTSIGRVKNLSRSGALICGCELQLFSLVQINLRDATVSGYVTRLDADGAGIEWCEFAPPVVAELLQKADPMVSTAAAPLQPAAPVLPVTEPLANCSS